MSQEQRIICKSFLLKQWHQWFLLTGGADTGFEVALTVLVLLHSQIFRHSSSLGIWPSGACLFPWAKVHCTQFSWLWHWIWCGNSSKPWEEEYIRPLYVCIVHSLAPRRWWHGSLAPGGWDGMQQAALSLPPACHYSALCHCASVHCALFTLPMHSAYLPRD